MKILNYQSLNCAPLRLDIITYDAVEFDAEYRVAVAVVAYFRSALEVAHFEFAWRVQADHRDEARAEQSLHDTRVLRSCNTPCKVAGVVITIGSGSGTSILFRGVISIGGSGCMELKSLKPRFPVTF